MADEQIRSGKILRVVQVRFVATADDEPNLDASHGYGILQGDDGQDVFFVDSALQDVELMELKTGRDALYVMEAGPLGRAAKVWVAFPRQATHRKQADKSRSSNSSRGRRPGQVC